jgi:hypothetical protein
VSCSDIAALVRKLPVQRNVLIPPAMEKLDEADVAFEQSSGKQAIGRITAGNEDVGTIGIERGLRFARQIGQFGNRCLHAERHLIGIDPRESFRIAQFGGSPGVEFFQIIEQRAALIARCSGRVAEIENRIGPRTQTDALVRSR